METEDRLRPRVDQERAGGVGGGASLAAGSELRLRDGDIKVRRDRA